MSDESKLIVSVISVFLIFFSLLAITSVAEEYNRQEAIIEQTRILADVLKEAAKASPDAAAKARITIIAHTINPFCRERRRIFLR